MRPAVRSAATCGAAALAFAVVATGTGSVAREWNCPTCDDIPWAWDDNEPPPADNPPLPQGFALTVAIPVSRPASLILDRYAQVGEALGRCWDPGPAVGGHRWDATTLRVSFKRDGTVNGVPRVVYISDRADPNARSGVRSSLLAALNRCTPLPVSPSLGQAIAGQIFAIHFIQQGQPS